MVKNTTRSQWIKGARSGFSPALKVCWESALRLFLGFFNLEPGWTEQSIWTTGGHSAEQEGVWQSLCMKVMSLPWRPGSARLVAPLHQVGEESNHVLRKKHLWIFPNRLIRPPYFTALDLEASFHVHIYVDLFLYLLLTNITKPTTGEPWPT